MVQLESFLLDEIDAAEMTVIDTLGLSTEDIFQLQCEKRGLSVINLPQGIQEISRKTLWRGSP